MKFFTSIILFCLVLIPSVTFAQNFLVGIPGIGDPSGDFDGYIQAIYAMFISIAALLAVVKIIIAGVKYMFTDIVPQKTQAKKDIQGALLGLVVVLGAVLILTVINPELTNFNIVQNQINVPPPTGNSSDEDTSVCNEGRQCEVFLCVSEGCISEEAACTTNNNRQAFPSPPNSLICAGIDRSWDGFFGGATEREILEIIGNRNIPCSNNESLSERCVRAQNLCIDGTVFDGRIGAPSETTINGQVTIVCEPTLSDEERVRIADQVGENADLLGTRIACNTAGQLNASTLGRYWWDTETDRCRTVDTSQTTVSLSIDEDFLASSNYIRMADGLGAGRSEMLTDPARNDAMTRVCNAHYGSGNRSISFVRNGINYQSEAIGNIRYNTGEEACVFSNVVFRERSNQLAPANYQLQ